MKTFALLTIMLSSLNASAQPADDGSVCGRFLTCGQFETTDSRNPSVMRGLEVIATGHLQVELKTTVSNDPNRVTSQTWSFDEKGGFQAYQDGRLRAIGTCDGFVCVAGGAWADKDKGPVTQSLLFHFAPNQIDLNKVHVKADASTSSTGQVSFVLKK